jgi:hypothetical protein
MLLFSNVTRPKPQPRRAQVTGLVTMSNEVQPRVNIIGPTSISSMQKDHRESVGSAVIQRVGSKQGMKRIALLSRCEVGLAGR